MRYHHISTLFSWLAAAVSLSAVRAVPPPGCQSGAAPAQTTLTNVTTALVSLPGRPFALINARQANVSFVSLTSNNYTVGVLNTSTFTPTLIRRINIPAAYRGDGVNGLALTKDGRYLFAAVGPGALVFDTAKAIAGGSGILVGRLNGTTSTQSPGQSAIEVTLSKDDQYAFVSQEYGAVQGQTPGNIDVFKLNISGSDVAGTPVGFVNLGGAVVGSALSPDGRNLYVTSELVSNSVRTNGLLSVLDVATLETKPGQSVRANASAGCQPVRELVSKDGRIVWVTARASNRLLAFNASTLVSQPNNSLIASIEVGTQPVGLTFARNETRILTADSDRSVPNATTGISVVDVEAALAGSSQAVLGRIPTGDFPRDFALSADGKTLLVACYSSSQIQAIDVTTLP